MANLRIDSGCFRHLGLALLMGTLIYGGSLLSGQPPTAPQPQETVVEVRITGNQAMTKSEILKHVRTRAGRALSSETIEEDVRRLSRTRLFVTVKPYTQKVPGGRIVVYDVVERPVLKEVVYWGNSQIKSKVLRKETDLKPGDAADPFSVKEAQQTIEAFYHSKGFSRAHVTIVEGNEPGDRRAVFMINEAGKQRIFETRFVGNSIASDGRLKTQIKSKPGILWYFKGMLNQGELEEDVNRLTAYYRSLGYFKAKVGHPIVEFNDARTWASVTFVINEGPRYKIRNVSFVGNENFSDAQLASHLKLEGNQYFDQAAMSRDELAIRDEYGSIGYAFVEANARLRFPEEPGELDLVYEINEGARFRIGRIEVKIEGDYPHTKTTTVLNRLSFKPGDILNVRQLRASERRLRSSGLFEIDMARGVAPKVVFSPPEFDDAQEQIARPPRGGPTVRGQSPDLVPCGGYQYIRSPQSRPGDRRIDLVLPCRRVPPPQPSHGIQNAPQQPGGYDGTTLGPPSGAWQTPAPRQVPLDVPREDNTTSYFSLPTWDGQPVVVRGQYSSDRGWSVPQPTLPNQPSQPPLANQPGPADPPYARMAAAPTLPNGLPILGDPSIYRDPNVPPSGDPLQALDVDILLNETQTGRLMFGMGVNSDAGLVGSIVIDERNFDLFRPARSFEDVRNHSAFRGGGQRFRIELVPGTELQRYMFNFQDPYLFDTDVSFGLSGFYYNRRYLEYDEERLGGQISLGYQFTHDLTGSFAFRAMNVTIFNPAFPAVPEIAEVEGKNGLFGFKFQLAHDTRDSTFLATEGHLIQMSAEQVIGTFDYPRAEIDVRQYFLIHERPDTSGRHVLSLSARAAYTGSNTPIYEHYYAGGFSTIRGFDFRGASPRDPATGMLVGGEFMLLASAQYMFPLTADDNLRAVVFCDTGTVQPTIDNWSDKYRIAPGFGLRISVAAMGPAPIALDFAFPISSEITDREEIFSFFVGFNH
ncbi:MAG: BamA/TamA family outer membrane protein [Candidatus Nealsonbacteria bacterium]|nr:BamA/TamA family outer membrane protein [Candidatus Nealsonbacteria bacterium]